MHGTALVPADRARQGLVDALLADVATVLRGWPARAYIALELVASAFLVLRRGPWMLPLLGTILAGAVACLALAWASGRMPQAHPELDLVRRPRAESVAVTIAWAGLFGWFTGLWPGSPVPPAALVFAIGFWAWIAIAAGAWIRDTVARGRDPGRVGGPRPGRGAGRGRRPWPTELAPELAWLWRGWWPLWPLLGAIVAAKLPLEGLGLVTALGGTLASGVTQQVLLQVGLMARLEAALHRADAAAVLAAVGFGAVHVAMDLPQADGDWWIAAANAAVLQTTFGLVACTAYLRHRAPLAVGLGHALMMA